MPEELVYLPHVESSYRWNARSNVGALGMWQFMATTARKYILVDQAVDERLDPYTAARAAARYLQNAYDELGTWPLAITSYNHGVDGMKNAVRDMDTTDIDTHHRRTTGARCSGSPGGTSIPSSWPRPTWPNPARRSRGPGPGRAGDLHHLPLPAYVKLETAARRLRGDPGSWPT